MEPILTTEFEGMTLAGRGKVRDIYDFDDHLLIVATDRLSAFDVVLPTPIPDKGKVLTQISAYWFSRMSSVVGNHMVSVSPEEYPVEAREHADQLAGRSMLVRRCEPLPVECVVRGYVAGSGWKEYQQESSISEIGLPSGLRQCDRLPEPIFTPATKAERGTHDENISFNRMESIIGSELAARLRDLSLEVYLKGSEEAAGKGIIIADTKFEFGLIDGELLMIDELLTPDSSRFWPAETYTPGVSQESLDKQYVRNYLETLDWDKTDPGPELPEDVVAETSRRYRKIYEWLTGSPL
ncbi:MAG: phosphoribosylaminoimidazolesuccinocarboxamide synthase [Candidatus Latescibacteria bacterium]|nr:phosphoribosylaminoimidazolesuccinocarboxamide synthase [Candidatus Latescibacterota bacterium]